MKTTGVLQRAACFVLALSMILILTACGKKGPVRPKLATLPEQPQELSLQQRGDLFVLGWTIPAGANGTKTMDLAGYVVKRLSYDVQDGCPTCREPEQVVARLDVDFPDPAQRFDRRIYWQDLDIRPGNGYSYAVAPVTVGGSEGPTATDHLAVQVPPPPPTGLAAEPGDGQVSLQWTAPELPPEVETVGYNLYRRQDDRAFPIVPVNPQPLPDTALVDRGLDNGRTYQYRVGILVRVDGLQLESVPGATVTATPAVSR